MTATVTCSTALSKLPLNNYKPMKKSFFVFSLFLLSPLSSTAQIASRDGGLSSSLRVSSAVEEPTSSIDLLKKGIQSSSQTVSGVASAQPTGKKTASAAAVTDAPAQASKTVPAPAEPAKTAPLPAEPASVPMQPVVSTDPTTLDMPLPVAESTSVQTKVAPVKKPLSPAVARRVEEAKQKREQTEQGAAVPTEVERAIETENALLPPSSKKDLAAAAESEPTPEEVAADAELEYAVRQLEESKEKAASAGRRIPPPASKNRPKQVPAANKPFNPNAYRPGVTWIASKSNHFDIYTQKRDSGIPSANMSMMFESAYQTLARFIPWMMSGRVRVFVYQDRASYLRHEPNALAWSNAVAYPTRGEIVVYDEPKKSQELKESFTHELTHIFTQQFFDSHKTGRLMTPLWLDEGLAVMMEDHAYNGAKGGPWANDFKTLNFQRSKASTVGGGLGSSSMFGSSSGNRLTNNKRRGKPVIFMPFELFMQEDSLQVAEGRDKTQDWYFQAYTMVRFLLNPSGASMPSNRLRFEQFTRLLAQGEAKRDPSTGFLIKDKNGKTVYEPYSVEKALGKAYNYNSAANFEDNFWRWADKR